MNKLPIIIFAFVLVFSLLLTVLESMAKWPN